MTRFSERQSKSFRERPHRAAEVALDRSVWQPFGLHPSDRRIVVLLATTELPPLSGCVSKPGHHSLPDEIGLELGRSTEDSYEQSSRACGHVDLIRDGDEFNAERVELVEHVNKLVQAPKEPVHFKTSTRSH